MAQKRMEAERWMVREATGRQAVRSLGQFTLEAAVGLAVPSKSFRSVTTKVSLLKIPQKSEPIHIGCYIWNGLSNRESREIREIREKEGSERGSSASNHFTRRMNDTNSINTLVKSKACPAGVMLCESSGFSNLRDAGATPAGSTGMMPCVQSSFPFAYFAWFVVSIGSGWGKWRGKKEFLRNEPNFSGVKMSCNVLYYSCLRCFKGQNASKKTNPKRTHFDKKLSVLDVKRVKMDGFVIAEGGIGWGFEVSKVHPSSSVFSVRFR